MKKKKEFVSILENSHKFISGDDSTAKKVKIFKKNDLQSEKSIEQMQWSNVNEKVPDVLIIENEGQIEAIKFKCRCGCGALIKIEYENEQIDKVLN